MNRDAHPSTVTSSGNPLDYLRVVHKRRWTALTVLFLVVLVATAGRQSLRVTRAALPLVALSGMGDMSANALFLLATQQEGQLAITGVLASLYPVSTVLLAQALLRERLVGAQVAGLGAAVVAVVLITLPG